MAQALVVTGTSAAAAAEASDGVFGFRASRCHKEFRVWG